MKADRRVPGQQAPPLLAAVDCGTSAIKAGLFRPDGGMQSFATCPAPLTLHKDGRVETDADLTFACVIKCLADCAAAPEVNPGSVVGLAVTNQRATLVCSDIRGRATGPAIVWQDMRGAGEIDALRKRIDDRAYFRLTGLPNHPVFSLAKMLWLVRRQDRRARGRTRFGLLQDYLLRRLGAKDLFCDLSNASLTGLLDVKRLDWSDAILQLTGIHRDRLPHLVASGLAVGTLSAAAASATGLREGTPLISGGGDQQCAGLGAGAAEPGVTVVCLGTAAAPLCLAESVRRDPRMRVTCCAHAVPGRWNVEGLQNCAGASLQWLRCVTQGPGHFASSTISAAAEVPPGARGVLFYPYLDGAAAPHWDARATGAFLGLRLEHDRAALVRAVMEGVSMETREILDVFASLRLPCREVRVTGGCSTIAAWNQIQADIYGKPVCTLANEHATLLGAAMLAAVGAGVHADCPAAARRMATVRQVFAPDPGNARAYEGVYGRFREVRRQFERVSLFERIGRVNV